MTKAPKPTASGTGPATTKPAAKPRAAKTPAAKSLAPKPAAAAGATVRPVAPVRVPKPAQDVPEGPLLRRKEFVERVLSTSGAKKKDAQTVIDAVLRVMGEALSKGETLMLPPFGRARVSRQVALGAGEMLVVKLRRGHGQLAGKGEKTASEALAETDD